MLELLLPLEPEPLVLWPRFGLVAFMQCTGAASRSTFNQSMQILLNTVSFNPSILYIILSLMPVFMHVRISFNLNPWCASRTNLSSEVGAESPRPAFAFVHSPESESQSGSEVEQLNSIRDTSQKSTSRKHDGYAQSRLGAAPSARIGKDVRGGGNQCAGHVHRGALEGGLHAVADARMYTCVGGSRFKGRRRRNERKTQRESGGAGDRAGPQKAAMLPSARVVMHLHTPGNGGRSGQHEVSDMYIDEHGCPGNAPIMSARRSVERAMLENVGTHN
ncbi:hypothetical protein B0H13DRAFT_2281503 [Mycena leptocephala]|nr:hypothetical protein B0H13DRAFT_2281503 [Mycena leptocephala]